MIGLLASLFLLSSTTGAASPGFGTLSRGDSFAATASAGMPNPGMLSPIHRPAFVRGRSGEFRALCGDAVLAATDRGFAWEAADCKPIVVEIGGGRRIWWQALEPGPILNHYHGGAKNWRSNVPAATALIAKRVLTGIDAILHSYRGRPEVDFRIRPGADPRQIALRFDAGDDPSLAANGSLHIGKDGRHLELAAPRAYQPGPGGQTVVPVRYVLRGREARFELGSYDRARPLVIDPVIEMSLAFGGSDREGLFGMGVDSENNIILAGSTTSTDLLARRGWQPLLKGSDDIFVCKLSPAGQLLWSTFLGGTQDENPWHLLVDRNDQITIVGHSSSPDFPLLRGFNLGASSDAVFVTRLNRNGRIVYSGRLAAEQTYPDAAIVTPDSSVVVAGYTRSDWLPLVNPLQRKIKGGIDFWFLRISPVGQPVFCSYFGGASNEAFGWLTACPDGGFGFAGLSASADFPTKNPAFPEHSGLGDAVVVRFNSDMSVRYSTYLGGSGREWADEMSFPVASLSNGDLVVAGNTYSADFPGTRVGQGPPGLSDIYLTRFDKDGRLLSSAIVSGSSWDEFPRIAVDRTDHIALVGITASPDVGLVNAQSGVRGGIIVGRFSPLLHPHFLAAWGSNLDMAPTQPVCFPDGSFAVCWESRGQGFTAVAPLPGASGASYAALAKFSSSGVVQFSSKFVKGHNASILATALDRQFRWIVSGEVYSGHSLDATATIPGVRLGINDAFIARIRF